MELGLVKLLLLLLLLLCLAPLKGTLCRPVLWPPDAERAMLLNSNTFWAQDLHVEVLLARTVKIPTYSLPNAALPSVTMEVSPLELLPPWRPHRLEIDIYHQYAKFLVALSYDRVLINTINTINTIEYSSYYLLPIDALPSEVSLLEFSWNDDYYCEQKFYVHNFGRVAVNMSMPAPIIHMRNSQTMVPEVSQSCENFIYSMGQSWLMMEDLSLNGVSYEIFMNNCGGEQSDSVKERLHTGHSIYHSRSTETSTMGLVHAGIKGLLFAVLVGLASIDTASLLSYFGLVKIIRIAHILLTSITVMFLTSMILMLWTGLFNFLYVKKVPPPSEKERKREQKRLRRPQLLLFRLQNAQMFLSVKLSEFIALLKAIHSGWGLPIDLVIRMLNSKLWVMEADAWADLLYICRWANPIHLKEVLCTICNGPWDQPIASDCSHLFCCTCILDGIKKEQRCPHKRCGQKLSVTPPIHKQSVAETLVKEYNRQRCKKNLKSLKRFVSTAHCQSRKRDREDDTGACTIPPSKSQCVECPSFTRKDHSKLFELLRPAMNKWINLGLCLGLPRYELECLEKKRLDNEEGLRDMLDLAIRSKGFISQEELIQALKSPTVDMIELVDSVSRYQ